jgi:hypothetical protein
MTKLLPALIGARDALRKGLPYLPPDNEAVHVGEWLDEINETIAAEQARRYRVVWRDACGESGVLAPGPFTHHEGCVVLSKFSGTYQPKCRIELEEITQ